MKRTAWLFLSLLFAPSVRAGGAALATGQTVQAQWQDGNDYPGVVLGQSTEDLFEAIWEGGSAPLWVRGAQLQTPDGQPLAPSKRVTGAQVLAEWLGTGSYYPAQLGKTRKATLIQVQWDDGSPPSWVDAAHVRAEVREAPVETPEDSATEAHPAPPSHTATLADHKDIHEWTFTGEQDHWVWLHVSGSSPHTLVLESPTGTLSRAQGAETELTEQLAMSGPYIVRIGPAERGGEYVLEASGTSSPLTRRVAAASPPVAAKPKPEPKPKPAPEPVAAPASPPVNTSVLPKAFSRQFEAAMTAFANHFAGKIGAPTKQSRYGNAHETSLIFDGSAEIQLAGLDEKLLFARWGPLSAEDGPAFYRAMAASISGSKLSCCPLHPPSEIDTITTWLPTTDGSGPEAEIWLSLARGTVVQNNQYVTIYHVELELKHHIWRTYDEEYYEDYYGE